MEEKKETHVVTEQTQDFDATMDAEANRRNINSQILRINIKNYAKAKSDMVYFEKKCQYLVNLLKASNIESDPIVDAIIQTYVLAGEVPPFTSYASEQEHQRLLASAKIAKPKFNGSF